MQATLRIGIADGQLAIQVDGKEIVMDLDQSLELFNAIGEVLEELGVERGNIMMDDFGL